MNSYNVSIVFGITFIVAGLIGFVPNPLVAPDGLFEVNFAHNLVHLFTGIAFLLVSLNVPEKSNLVIKVIGAAYTVVAIAGFLTSGDMLLGLVHINEADRWLHLGLAVAILGAGFMLPKKRLVTV